MVTAAVRISKIWLKRLSLKGPVLAAVAPDAESCLVLSGELIKCLFVAGYVVIEIKGVAGIGYLIVCVIWLLSKPS